MISQEQSTPIGHSYIYNDGRPLNLIFMRSFNLNLNYDYLHLIQIKINQTKINNKIHDDHGSKRFGLKPLSQIGVYGQNTSTNMSTGLIVFNSLNRSKVCLQSHHDQHLDLTSISCSTRLNSCLSCAFGLQPINH